MLTGDALSKVEITKMYSILSAGLL